MRSLSASFTLALLLAAAGGLLWLAGAREERLAAAEYHFVTLRYETAAIELADMNQTSLLDPLFDRLGVAAGTDAITVRYWQGDYAAAADSEAPELKLLATNADYRSMRAAGGTYQAVVGRLDNLAKRYADVLRSDPGNEDAAYNYEFILRLRQAAMMAKQPIPPRDPGDTGITMHGAPGIVPPESDGKKFKMIVPMMPDERQEAEEAGRAGRKVRKG